MADPKGHKAAGGALGRQLAAMGARARELAGWVGAHVLRRRAAQVMVLLLVAIVAGLVAVVHAPLPSETRIIIAMAAGFALFGFLLLYLGYRSWDLARRLSREAAKSREMLGAVRHALETQQKRIKADADFGAGLHQTLSEVLSRQSSFAQALGSANENWLKSNARAEQTAAALDELGVRLRGVEEIEAALLKSGDEMILVLQDLRRQQSAYVQGLGATNAQMLETASKSERLAGALESQGSRLDKLDIGLADLASGMQGALAAQTRANETQGVENLARLEASDVRLSRLEQGLSALGAATFATGNEIAELAALQQLSVADLKELIARSSAVEERLGKAQLVEAQQFEELARKTATLEAIAQASHERLLSDLARARATAAQRDDAIAAAASELAERLARAEAAVLALAEQGDEPLARIAVLEQHVVQLAQSGEASMDELLAQLTSLKEFARAEAGQVADNSVAIKMLGSTVDTLLVQTAALNESGRANAEKTAQHATRIEAVSGSANALSTQIEALKRYRRADGDLVAAQAADLKALADTTDSLFAQLVSLKDVARLEADRLATLSDAVNGLGTSVEQSLIRLTERTADLTNAVSGGAARAEELEQSFGALRFLVESSATESDLLALRQQIEEFFGQVEAASSEQSVRTLELVTRMEAAEQAGRAALERTAVASSELAGLLGEVGAIGGQVREHHESLSLLQVTAATDGDRIEALTDLVSALRAAMDEAAGAGDGELEEIQRRLDDLSRGFSDTARSSQGLMEELASQLSALRDVMGLEAGRIDKLTAKLGSLGDQEAADVEKIQASLAEITTRIEAAIARIDAGKDVPAKLAEIQAALAQEAGRAETLSSKLTTQMGPLEKSVRANEAEVEIVKKGLADLSRSFGAATSSSRQVIEHLSEQMTSLREAMTGEFGRVGTLGARLAELQESFEDASRADEERRLQVAQELALLSGQIAHNAARLESGIAGEVDRRPVADGAGWYEPNNRQLRADHVEQLETAWARRLSLDITRPAIGYMTGRIATLERELDGRLRASIEDTLLRSLIARSVKSASVRVLELGASFGLETAVMYDQVKDHFADVSFTIVDPLDSIARDARTDRQTGLQVSERIMRRNLARVGLANDQVSLIRRSSTDMEAIAQTSGATYDVLVIDGDHSYAGVKADFENYSRLVRLGGYIIFAEYGSAEWPDVQDFVDREVSVATHTSLVGASWRTAAYRVVRAPKEAAKPTVRARPAAATRRKK